MSTLSRLAIFSMLAGMPDARLPAQVRRRVEKRANAIRNADKRAGVHVTHTAASDPTIAFAYRCERTKRKAASKTYLAGGKQSTRA